MATPIRGQTRPLPIKVGLLETQKLNANINASIHNRFDVEVIDTKTGKVRQRAHGENVICSQLWTRLFAPNTYFNYIHYGTGSGTPATADTSLFTFLGYGTPAATPYDVYSKSTTDGYTSLTRKIQLSETTAVGSTLTEVGIGYGTTASTLVTHAMLKDMNGNTISIAKTSTDIINIYATVFVHWSVSKYDSGYVEFYSLESWPDYYGYSTFTYWLLGTRSMGTGGFYAWFSAGNNRRENYFGSEAEATALHASAITPTYNAAEKKLTMVAARLPVGGFNISGGIGCVTLGYVNLNSSSQYNIPTGEIFLKVGGAWYPGTDITNEAIGTGDGATVDFETDYTMVSGAAIKVNGVEVTSGVTIDENIPSNLSNMGRNFELLSFEPLSGIAQGSGLGRACGLEDPTGTNY